MICFILFIEQRDRGTDQICDELIAKMGKS